MGTMRDAKSSLHKPYLRRLFFILLAPSNSERHRTRQYTRAAGVAIRSRSRYAPKKPEAPVKKMDLSAVKSTPLLRAAGGWMLGSRTASASKSMVASGTVREFLN